jgi:hypothetical protein
MSLSAREQQVLDSIKDGLAGSDPELAALLGTFTRLMAGEEMPVRQKIRADWWGAARRSRRKRRHTRRHRGNVRRHAHRLYQRLGFQRAALLLWLLITVALIAVGVSLSRGGSQGGCPGSWAAVCAGSAPAHSSRPAAHETVANQAPPTLDRW